ncbi:nucleotide exchange factor GrpE [Inquilinus sp. CAU 1745]|uniref:nucleotide exchange factor GrpE n=1 Tax=Inquilinus sp. CAU 1745 TaxID=3140369 RepID=UPI00325C19D6
MTDTSTHKTEADAVETEEVLPPEEGAAEEAMALDPVEVLREENAKLKDQMLRALADAENTRRRAEREKEDTAKYAVTKFARDILNVADNLRRAMEAVPDDAKQGNPAMTALVEGVEATERELLDAFGKHGVTRIDPLEEKFDPNFHQAMFEVENTGRPPGTIVQVMAAGYVLNGRLLRPAMVGVAKGEPPKVDTTA